MRKLSATCLRQLKKWRLLGQVDMCVRLWNTWLKYTHVYTIEFWFLLSQLKFVEIQTKFLLCICIFKVKPFYMQR